MVFALRRRHAFRVNTCEEVHPVSGQLFPALVEFISECLHGFLLLRREILLTPPPSCPTGIGIGGIIHGHLDCGGYGFRWCRRCPFTGRKRPPKTFNLSAQTFGLIFRPLIGPLDNDRLYFLFKRHLIKDDRFEKLAQILEPRADTHTHQRTHRNPNHLFFSHHTYTPLNKKRNCAKNIAGISEKYANENWGRENWGLYIGISFPFYCATYCVYCGKNRLFYLTTMDTIEITKDTRVMR